MKSCPKCGNPNPSGKFCIKCGAPLTEPLKNEVDEIIKNEAEKIDNNDNETSKKAIETKNVVENNKAEKADVEKNDDVHNEVSQNENAKPVIKNEPVKSNKKGIITISVIVALVLVCVGGYFIYQNNQNNKKDEPIADEDKIEDKEETSETLNIEQSAIFEIENGKYIEVANKIGGPFRGDIPSTYGSSYKHFGNGMKENEDHVYPYIKNYDVDEKNIKKIIIKVEDRVESQALLGGIKKFSNLLYNKEKGYLIENNILNAYGKNINIYYFVDTVDLSINYIAIVDESSTYDMIDILKDISNVRSTDIRDMKVCTFYGQSSGDKVIISTPAVSNIINEISINVIYSVQNLGFEESAITDDIKKQWEEAILKEMNVKMGDGVNTETDVKDGYVSIDILIDTNKAKFEETKLSDFIKTVEAEGAVCNTRYLVLNEDTAIPYLRERLMSLNVISEKEYYNSEFNIEREEDGCFIIQNYYNEGTHNSTLGWYSIDINNYEIKDYMTQKIIDQRHQPGLIS